MKRSSLEKLSELQKDPSFIRNICILAHVDHGKTTLADALVASNCIISQKMAGKLRYLDSREDEQIRGITMKSSAISLYFQKGVEEFLINLIDSPGHIDFSTEVSTAVRLCDGALVLVDVVEGVCPQTHAVLRQAWLENIKPVLVLNKIDRLILEWKMSPEEAQVYIQQVLEQVNAITGELFTSDVLAKSSQAASSQLSSNNHNTPDQKIFDWSSGLEETDDSLLYFSPEQGNVVFASAIDGWGFRIEQFAALYAKKVGVSDRVLNKTLWGDFYLDAKTKTVKKGSQAKGKKSLFVQLILENIWKIYDAVLTKRDKDLTERIIKTLELKVAIRGNDARLTLQSIFNQWLPLSNAVLAMVCDKLPNPKQISEERVKRFLSRKSYNFESLPLSTRCLKQDFISCSSSDSAPVIVFISKMFAVESKFLPNKRSRPLTIEEIAARRELVRLKRAEKEAAAAALLANPDINKETTNAPVTPVVGELPPNVENEVEPDNVFIAFARVFSGTIRKGQTLYVLGPKHDPSTITQGSTLDVSSLKHVSEFKVRDLFMFMGRELECLDEVPAGNVFGIGGLEDHVLKSATLSSEIFCPAFTDMYLEATPIVRVAVEPKHMADMNKLISGLKLLNQSDPCVEVMVQETGEHIIIGAGEVHLQKCLDDLRDRFAKVEINVSSPSVPFRETIVPQPMVDRVNEAIQDQSGCKLSDRLIPGVAEMSTQDDSATLRIRALPLPTTVTKLLDENVLLLKSLNRHNAAVLSEKLENLSNSQITKETMFTIADFKRKLEEAFLQAGEEWTDVVQKIWSVGPKRNCTNILVNGIEGYERPPIWNLLEKTDKNYSLYLRPYDSGIVNGFQMATQSGPLCEEPIMGVCFIVERWDVTSERSGNVSNSQSSCKFEPELSNSLKNADISGSSPDDSVARNPSEHSSADPTIDQQMSEDLSKMKLTDNRLTGGQFTGQLISCMKECCKRAFQSQPQRLMWAMYTCVIQATVEVLGKMYGVLAKRNGRILSEEMKEGSSLFDVTAILPVVESFGFADEFRKKTSGLASPQLRFSHWEVIDLDPFWVPTTEEEYLHYGEKADSENVARKYMNDIRRRKGLKVNEKIVEFGEKQRTLKKNK